MNELTARDTDDNGTDNYTLAYDAAGNMTDDGENYNSLSAHLGCHFYRFSGARLGVPEADRTAGPPELQSAGGHEIWPRMPA